MLPDMMETFLPTRAGKKMMLATLLGTCARWREAAEVPGVHPDDAQFLLIEAQLAEDTADWLEDVPVREVG